ncbi:hypothetical protein PCASD_16064 [Puccinia coronata f. sp. avenae]|uniref:Uncharacterized protein n=1 Tax=Puccinia coronata f. sp. avenae TaxID=200324 RepID=A0A2N5SYE7_9BASI|nr:hypothetical protein PCASD_16064 [Puccinia coronata f. sp. avenae]
MALISTTTSPAAADVYPSFADHPLAAFLIWPGSPYPSPPSSSSSSSSSLIITPPSRSTTLFILSTS